MNKLFNWQLILFLLAGLLVLESCSDNGIIEVPTSEETLQEDLDKIDEYVLEKGYTDVDTTQSRVRYVILEVGEGEPVEYNDIVSLDYAGMFLNDTVFDTSVESIALAKDLYDSTRTYAPFVFTHTQSGWGIEILGLVRGFSDGATAALKQMNVGGKARIIIPSALAYGSSGTTSIPGNTIIAFDLYPVKVRKQ